MKEQNIWSSGQNITGPELKYIPKGNFLVGGKALSGYFLAVNLLHLFIQDWLKKGRWIVIIITFSCRSLNLGKV